MSGSETISFLPLVILYVVTCLSIIYISIQDAKTMTIPAKASFCIVSIHLIVNGLLIILYGQKTIFPLWPGTTMHPSSNLISGFILGMATMLIIIVTRGKGLGRGDVLYLILLGLMCGYSKSILALYIAIFTAVPFALYVAITRKQFRNVKIPFVPFITTGIIGSLLLGDTAMLTIISKLSALIYSMT